MKQRFTYVNETYFGEINDNGCKNGLGVFEDRNKLYIGPFKEDVLNGYGFIYSNSSSKKGHYFGSFSGNEISGLGVNTDGITVKFGYFNNNIFESGFIIRPNKVELVFKKYENASLYIESDRVYFNTADIITNSYNIKIKLRELHKLGFNIQNYFDKYDLKETSDENKYCSNQVFGNSNVGFSLCQYKDNACHYELSYEDKISLKSTKDIVEYKSSIATFIFNRNSNYATLSYKKIDISYEYKIENNILSLSIVNNKIKYVFKFDSFLNFNYQKIDSNVLIDYKADKFKVEEPKITEDYNENAEEDLMNMIGLESVKRQINRIKCFVKKNRNKKINIHMAFLGNPGTGKTTVAKLIADIFYKYKVLKSPKMINANRRMLVGSHVGETSIKSRKLIEEAMGGVLIVDEAYALDGASEKDYGKEAISVLLTEMENNKGDFCCILAGYRKEMYKLFDVNPGFKSRIQYIINFDDFTTEELKLIAIQQAKKNNLVIEDEVMEKIVSILSFQKENTENFGNARDVRNIIEQLAMIATDRQENTNSITLEDVYKYMSENTLVDKRIKKAPMISFDELETFYKKEYKPIKYVDNKVNLFESVIQIVNSYDDITVRKAGFIISPNGYAVTIEIRQDECISSEAVRHIYDRKGNIIEVYSTASIASNTKLVSIIKLYNDGDFYSYAPLIYKGNIKDYLNKEVMVIGYLKTGDNSSYYSEKTAKITEIYDSGLLIISFKENITFMEGCPIIDCNTGIVVGVIVRDNKAISSNILLEIIKYTK